MLGLLPGRVGEGYDAVGAPSPDEGLVQLLDVVGCLDENAAYREKLGISHDFTTISLL